jgi:hypothetical protein
MLPDFFSSDSPPGADIYFVSAPVLPLGPVLKAKGLAHVPGR